jgi:hypothetical protein
MTTKSQQSNLTRLQAGDSGRAQVEIVLSEKRTGGAGNGDDGDLNTTLTKGKV